MTARETLLAEAAKRILITDGAFGTEIQNWKLSETDYAGSLGLSSDQKGNNDILALTKPEVPESIHRAYFAAGADIAETNTFSANRISQADYGAEHLVREINLESAQLARRVADELAAWFPPHVQHLDSALTHWLCKLQHGAKPVVLRVGRKPEAALAC